MESSGCLPAQLGLPPPALLRQGFEAAGTTVRSTQSPSLNIMSASSIPALVRALGSDGNRAAVAAKALAELALENSTNRAAIKEAGGIPALLQCLGSSTSESAQLEAVCALSRLGLKNPTNIIAIVEAGGIPALVRCLGSSSEGLQQEQVGCF